MSLEPCLFFCELKNISEPKTFAESLLGNAFFSDHYHFLKSEKNAASLTYLIHLKEKVKMLIWTIAKLPSNLTEGHFKGD